MALAQLPPAHELLDVLGELEQAQQVGDGRPAPAEALGQRGLGLPEVLHPNVRFDLHFLADDRRRRNNAML